MENSGLYAAHMRDLISALASYVIVRVIAHPVTRL
jgi:hypothetical protein